MAQSKKSTVPSLAPQPDEDWRAENDMRTLVEAEQIKRDPKRLARARAVARRHLANLQAAANLTKKGS